MRALNVRDQQFLHPSLILALPFCPELREPAQRAKGPSLFVCHEFHRLEVRLFLLPDGQCEPIHRGVERVPAGHKGKVPLGVSELLDGLCPCVEMPSPSLPGKARPCVLYCAVVLIGMCDGMTEWWARSAHLASQGQCFRPVLMLTEPRLEPLQQRGLPNSLATVFSNCETIIFNI